MNRKPLTSREFFKLLQGRTPRNAERLDLLLRDRAERDVTVFVSDSSGFTRKTNKYGITQFLAVMTQSYERLLPVFKKHEGIVFSTAADNVVAVFPDPDRALRTAVELQQRLRRFNKGRKDAEQFHLCIGIDTGRALLLTDNVFGACVNTAAKLGEDLAGKGEILVTGGVAQQIGRRFRCSYDRTAEVGGRPIELHRVSY